MNVGKRFEHDWSNSIPDYCLLIRLYDPPHSFTQRSDTKFSHKNPCDYICYNSKNNVMYCLELKTTSYKSMSFDDINNSEMQNKMVKKHQIKALLEFSKYDGVIAGFVFNFRHFENTEKYFETTYFQNINDFISMCNAINKKSFNEIDLVLNNAIKIDGKKKRTRYHWDISDFFNRMNNGR